MFFGGGHLGFPIGIKKQKLRFFSETTWTIETKLPNNDHWKVLYKILVFYANQKSKIAATTGHKINIRPYMKKQKLKFVENHPMNIHEQFNFNHMCSF
jgi:hypothetical protein